MMLVTKESRIRSQYHCQRHSVSMQSSLLLIFLLINIVAGQQNSTFCPTFGQMRDIRMKLKDNVKLCKKGQPLTIDNSYVSGVYVNYLAGINESCEKYKQLVNWEIKIEGHIEDLDDYSCL